jgi:hypothetical protein
VEKCRSEDEKLAAGQNIFDGDQLIGWRWQKASGRKDRRRGRDAETGEGKKMIGREADAGWEQERNWAKKRPSVETEGRLTIACHMKNLQKIDVGVSLSSICLCPYLLPAVTKIMTRKYF